MLNSWIYRRRMKTISKHSETYFTTSKGDTLSELVEQLLTRERIDWETFKTKIVNEIITDKPEPDKGAKEFWKVLHAFKNTSRYYFNELAIYGSDALDIVVCDGHVRNYNGTKWYIIICNNTVYTIKIEDEFDNSYYGLLPELISIIRESFKEDFIKLN